MLSLLLVSTVPHSNASMESSSFLQEALSNAGESLTKVFHMVMYLMYSRYLQGVSKKSVLLCPIFVLSRFSASSILGLVFLREKYKFKEFASKFTTVKS